MNEHVLDWINAYHDGELRGDRLRSVTAHLAACAACQAELEALRRLSARLQASPAMPARTPPEQFVAQVGLRLPARSAPPPGRQRVRQAAGLWLPLGALALWAFFQAVLAAGSLVAAALPVDVPWLQGWGAWLGLLALDMGLTAALAVLVWGCLAGWWAARESNLTLSGEQAGT